MRQILRRGLVVLVATGLAAALVVGGGSPASGGNTRPSERATITIDRSTCLITGTYTWKNHTADIGKVVWIGLYRNTDPKGYVAGPYYSTVTAADESYMLTYTATPGVKYVLNGNMPDVDGTFDSSKAVSCR